MQTALTYRTNRDLFSNYYLDEHLPETEAWDELSEDELREAKADIMDLWEREKETAPKRNESQLEEKFIRPMFRKLGIPFEVEESTSRTQRRPDYGFFESQDVARGAFERREGGGDFYKDAVAVADAKRWGRPLDTRGSGEHERDFENPSYQIHVYLQETPAQWAVLTDGKKWRLYYAPTSHRLDSYYEIDLPTVLEKGDLKDFKYFYLFFRHGAFIEDSSGECFLDEVYDESNVFARELGEDLQDNIYEAIKILSEGFMRYPDNDLSEGDLGLIHDSSLIYLYRLIFVLYAESEGRDLLDTNNEVYEDSYSLNTLKQEIAEQLDSPNPKYRDWQDTLWNQLDELFKLIDQGSRSRGIPVEDLYIPAYNGGLFRTDPDEDDSVEARFLANHQVGDASLSEVIDLLTRSQNNNGGGKIFVDYSSLDVRHLGSIYEGLLEYQLDVADEPLALEDGEYVPADEGDEVIVEEGEVHLSTGSGERKATGSYYTPEYVVEYIVEETLGPLVEDIRMDFVGQSAYDEGGFAEEFAEEVFNLKVLDPAMGSGHFLTSAIDYLAREIIDAQERQAAQQGIETVNEEHDINWARRQVAQRCIYGVDLNPLAVELAKVSLWLRTLAAEQPLAFLDHHLKTGNSLVGSDIETVLDNGDSDADAKKGQITLQESFDRTRRQALEHVTDQFESLLAIDNETLDDIKEMESVYEEVRDDPLYQNLIAMANVHSAEQFGLDVPDNVYKRMAEALRDGSWGNIEEQDWYRSAQAMAEDERFFHWELEFPIAFYEQDGKRKVGGGFDAVIGNPPYIRIQTISSGNPTRAKYYKEQYDSTVGKYDIFVIFIEKGIEVMSIDGQFGMIVPNKFIQSNYGSGIREILLKSDTLDRIVDFGDSQVFKGQSTYTSILLLSNLSEESFSYSETTDERLENLDFNPIDESSLSSDPWNPATGVEADVLNKLLSNPINLGDISEEIFQGVITGGDDYFILEKAGTAQEDDIQRVRQRDGDQVYEIESELLQPFIKGDGIRRFYAEERDTYLLYPYADGDGSILSENELKNQYPKGFRYLSDHRDGLQSRGSESMDYETWYALWNPRQMWKFDADKILTPVIAQSGRFCPDESRMYFNGSGGGGGGGYGIILEESTSVSERYVAAVLNSSVCDFIIRYTSSVFEGEFFAYNRQYIEPLPIPIDNADDGIDVDIPFEADRRSTCESVLESCVSEYGSAKSELYNLNLEIFDYLKIPSDGLPDSIVGETLGQIQMPTTGVADTPLVETEEKYDGLRIEGVTFADDGGRLVLSVDISYKIDGDNPRETDRWGRLAESEFETYEAMAFVGLSEVKETLLREFIPVAVEEAEGFAGFRQDATKTNSPLDRLKDLTLPDIDEIQTELEQYVEVREHADELEKKIEKTDRLIDEIVYDLYGLTDEEIEIVESAVQDD